MPMGITVHSYNLHGVLTMVSFMSSGCIHVWKKLFVMSIDPKILPVPQSARMLDMWGNGKLFVMVLPVVFS